MPYNLRGPVIYPTDFTLIAARNGEDSGRGQGFYFITVMPQITDKHSRSNQSACRGVGGVGGRKSLIVNISFIVFLNSMKLFRTCFPEQEAQALL